jgi:hypothetical protein
MKVKVCILFRVTLKCCSNQVRHDMPIRWNSTFLMLESVIGFQEVFILLNDIEPNFSCFSERSELG